MAGPDAFDDALAELWEQTRPRVLTRIDVLDEAAVALAAGTLDDGLRDRARTEAHRLAGSLGTFGIDDASPLARRLEHLLAGEPVVGDAPELSAGARQLRAAAVGGP